MKRRPLLVRARVTCPRCHGTHEPFVEVEQLEAERALAHVQRVDEKELRQAEPMRVDPPHQPATSDARISNVYVIRNPRSGNVKIGRAYDVHHRLNELQCASGDALELVAIVGAGPWLEHQLHTQFGAARCRGEWFDAAHPDVARWLQSLPGLRE